ncbi:MAG: rhodanese-like domain-containing protein [Pseudonocardiaceae bacterium]
MTTADRHPDTTTGLDTAALRTLLDTADAPRLIDVRTPGEFQAAHIPGSYNVPLDLLREHRDELRAHLDDQVVLICRSGQRAAQAEQALAAAGLPNLRVLDGGITAWQAAGAGLTVAAVTDTCALGMLLAKLPYNRGPRTDLDTVVTTLTGKP